MEMKKNEGEKKHKINMIIWYEPYCRLIYGYRSICLCGKNRHSNALRFRGPISFCNSGFWSRFIRFLRIARVHSNRMEFDPIIRITLGIRSKSFLLRAKWNSLDKFVSHKSIYISDATRVLFHDDKNLCARHVNTLDFRTEKMRWKSPRNNHSGS